LLQEAISTGVSSLLSAFGCVDNGNKGRGRGKDKGRGKSGGNVELLTKRQFIAACRGLGNAALVKVLAFDF